MADPLINVLLLPFHEAAWAKRRRKLPDGRARQLAVDAEKAGRAGLHASIAFAVMCLVTGSAAPGGIAALLESVCNALALPMHDRLWDRIERQGQAKPRLSAA